ncbi:MAG: MFS transporter, partial [Anaerotignum sp.]|nr:MFS transporter [Anaerotignum sp.]
MKTKNYLLSIVCVYMCYLTHGIQAIILSQNNINFATQWGFDMSAPGSAAYAAGLAAVSTAVAWVGLGKFVSVWIGGEISDRVGRKKMMIGGAFLYILCFVGFLMTKSALVASICGFLSGVATSGFWDAAGYPAVQEAYPKAPGSALIGIKFFVSLSGMIYPLFAVHMAATGNWKVNIMLPLVLSVICLVLAMIVPFVYDDKKKEISAENGSNKQNAVQAEIEAAKAAMLVKPSKFVVFLVMFYAFLCMSIMYGAQQYTKAFGRAVCGL